MRLVEITQCTERGLAQDAHEASTLFRVTVRREVLVADDENARQHDFFPRSLRFKQTEFQNLAGVTLLGLFGIDVHDVRRPTPPKANARARRPGLFQLTSSSS